MLAAEPPGALPDCAAADVTKPAHGSRDHMNEGSLPQNLTYGSRLSPAKLFEWALLGMLASAYLALLTSGAVDSPSLLIAGAAIVVRLLWVAGAVRFTVPDSATTALALAYIGFFPIDYYFLSREFLTATLHLVFFLAALITLRARTPREFFLVKAIAFSQILAACVLSLSLQFLVFLALFALCGIVAQVSGEIRYNLNQDFAIARRGLKGVSFRIAGLSLSLFAAILIIGCSLFFVLPRTAGMMFRGFHSERLRSAGYAGEVRLNQVGEIQLTPTPVLRARFNQAERVPGLKWRGDALVQFDGVRWYNRAPEASLIRPQNGQFPLVGPDYVWPRDVRRIAYEVKLDNVTGNELFFVGRPEVLRLDYAYSITHTRNGQVRAGNLSGRGLQYYAYSYIPESGAPRHIGWIDDELTQAVRTQTLALPEIDPRIAQLARDWTKGAPDNLVRGRMIERQLRTTFRYTTRMLDKPVPDPLAHFLFERKEGHCEYFASAMTVMLRTLDIPSRMATGFQSGTYNPITGWYMVRAADAHTWVEGYIPGHGWVSFDPTPPDPRAAAGTLAASLSLFLDAAEVFWQEWVLSYDFERQILLAGRLGQSSRSLSFDWSQRWKDARNWFSTGVSQTKPLVLPTVGAVAAGALIWLMGPRLLAFWRRRRHDAQLRRGQAVASDATLLYQRMLDLLRLRKLEKPAWMTPGEFVQVIPQPQLAALVNDLTLAYQDLRFGGRSHAARRMVALLEQLEQELR